MTGVTNGMNITHTGSGFWHDNTEYAKNTGKLSMSECHVTVFMTRLTRHGQSGTES